MRAAACRASPSCVLCPGPGSPRRGTQHSLASARGRAPRDSTSLRAGLPLVPPSPHGIGKPRSRAEREPPLRVEPVAAGSQGQSRGGGGGAPEGEKESAAESKRLVGEGCQDLGLLGLDWTRARKEAVAGHPAPIPSLLPSLFGWPRKVSLALQGRLA